MQEDLLIKKILKLFLFCKKIIFDKNWLTKPQKNPLKLGDSRSSFIKILVWYIETLLKHFRILFDLPFVRSGVIFYYQIGEISCLSLQSVLSFHVSQL